MSSVTASRTDRYEHIIDLLQQAESSHWIIGDALSSYSFTSWEWDELQRDLDQAGISHTVGTLKVYARVAGQISAEQRLHGVSFAAHQAALTIGDSDTAIKLIKKVQAEQGNPTRDRVLNEVRTLKGKQKVTTTEAAAAWRNLKAAVEQMSNLPHGQLDALLLLHQGRFAGQAVKLQEQISEIQYEITGSIARVENTLKGRPSKAASKPAPISAVAAEKPENAPKVKVGKLGKGRGL